MPKTSAQNNRPGLRQGPVGVSAQTQHSRQQARPWVERGANFCCSIPLTDMENSDPDPVPRPRRADVNRAIAQRMALQEGLISYSQLIGVGATPATVRSRVSSGLLTPRSQPPRRLSGPRERPTRAKRAPSSARQVYSAHAGPLSLNARRWAALLAAPEPSWLTHVTVFALLGVERPNREPIHVVHRGDGWRAPQGVIAHRTTSLPSRDLSKTNGLRHIAFARALLDAAADISEHRLDDVIDTSVRMEIYRADDVVRVLNDRPTLPETRRLAEAVGRLDATSGTFRSNFERRTKRLIERSTAIPIPAVNVLVEGFESDLWFPGTRAIIECDGRDYHRSPAQIAKDEEREAILRARGFVFLRLRWHHVVYEEERTLTRIERFVLANLDPPMA